jgi:exodeoxyribonuclease V alpha subunit
MGGAEGGAGNHGVPAQSLRWHGAPRRFGVDPIRDVQVLCPMNRGGAGARSLNIELQAALNPVGEQKMERFAWTLAAGDKVMQIENDYDKEVYNGDIGYIEEVDPDTSHIVATFDGRRVNYEFGDLDMLVPAYATTIHKSQGSEYPAVVIPVMTQHYARLQRNLLYTGVTRGKRLVVLVGQKKAVAIQFATFRVVAAGRSSKNCCVGNRLPASGGLLNDLADYDQ